MSTTELVRITPEQSAVIQVMGFTRQAMDVVIYSAQDAQVVSDMNRDLATRIDQVKAVHADLCAPAKLIRETADKYCKPAIEDMEEARRIQREKLAEWDRAEKTRIAAEKEKQEEEARKIRQEAERKAAEERAKADAKAAIERGKAQAAAEAERKALAEGNAAAAKKAAAERAKAEARETAVRENAGAKEAAIAIESAARTSAMPQVQESVKIAGTSFRDNWVGKLKPGVDTDKARMLIIQAAATHSPELAALIIIDEKSINKLAKALKSVMNVPGYVSVNEPIVAGARK